jgi:hypothetical protein
MSVPPKRYIRLVSMGALTWLRDHPELKPLVLRILRVIPPLERRLARFANAKGHGTLAPSLSPVWGIDADPDALSEWKKIANEASRTSSTCRR